MLERIVIDEAVRELRPDVTVLAITAEGLVNGPSDALTQRWLATAAKTAAAERAQDDPHLDARLLAISPDARISSRLVGGTPW